MASSWSPSASILFLLCAVVALTPILQTWTRAAVETDREEVILPSQRYLLTEIVKRPLFSTHSRDHHIDRSGPQARNETLLIILGSIRGGERAWHSMYRHLLDKNSADCALVIGEDPSEHYSSLYTRCDYIFEVEEQEDWGRLLDMIATDGRSLDDPVLAASLDWRWDGGWNTLGGVVYRGSRLPRSGGISLFLRWAAKQMILKYNLRSIYNRFVIGRADHFYACDLDLSEMDAGSIWIPTGQDYWGVNDRLLIASDSDITSALSIIDPVLLNSTFYRDRKETSIIEAMLKLRLEEMGLWSRVQRFNAPIMIIYRPNEKTSSNSNLTTIANASYGADDIFGIRSKYPSEYEKSIEFCANKDPNTLPVKDRRSETLFVVMHIDSMIVSQQENSIFLDYEEVFHRALFPRPYRTGNNQTATLHGDWIRSNSDHCVFVTVQSAVKREENEGGQENNENIEEEKKNMTMSEDSVDWVQCRYQWIVPYFQDWGQALLELNTFEPLKVKFGRNLSLPSFGEAMEHRNTVYRLGSFYAKFFKKRGQLRVWPGTLGGVYAPQKSTTEKSTHDNPTEDIDFDPSKNSEDRVGNNSVERERKRKSEYDGKEGEWEHVRGLGAVNLYMKQLVGQRLLETGLIDQYRRFAVVESAYLREHFLELNTFLSENLTLTDEFVWFSGDHNMEQHDHYQHQRENASQDSDHSDSGKYKEESATLRAQLDQENEARENRKIRRQLRKRRDHSIRSIDSSSSKHHPSMESSSQDTSKLINLKHSSGVGSNPDYDLRQNQLIDSDLPFLHSFVRYADHNEGVNRFMLCSYQHILSSLSVLSGILQLIFEQPARASEFEHEVTQQVLRHTRRMGGDRRRDHATPSPQTILKFWLANNRLLDRAKKVPF